MDGLDSKQLIKALVFQQENVYDFFFEKKIILLLYGVTKKYPF